METLTLKIDGMTCGGCVKSVQRVLNELAGMKQAEVSLNPAQAVITFSPVEISISTVIEAIEDAGFEAEVI